MKSIRYMLGGNPHNLDDCLDYSLKSIPNNALMAITPEEHTTVYMLTHLTASFYWIFKDKNTNYKKAYATIFSHQSKERQKSIIDSANKKLEQDLEKIAKSGISIKGSNSRFEHDLVY